MGVGLRNLLAVMLITFAQRTVGVDHRVSWGLETSNVEVYIEEGDTVTFVWDQASAVSLVVLGVWFCVSWRFRLAFTS